MFWLGWLIMSAAASDFSLLSDSAVRCMTILWLLGSLYTSDSAKLKLVHGRLDTRNRARVRFSVGNLACVRWNIGNSTIFKETVTFWHLLKEIYHYLFVMESFLIFALQFILRQKSVKGNVTITILYLKVFHTHTHNLYFTDFTLKLFIVIFCYCPVSLCVSGSCYR